jgi:hypothetical protein
MCWRPVAAVLSSGGKQAVLVDVMAAAEVLERWVNR